MTNRARPFRPRSRRRHYAIVVSATLLLGCGSEKRGGGLNPPTASIPLGARTASVYPSLPEWIKRQPWYGIDEYWRVSYDTWQTGISLCMQSKGFQYVVGKFTDPPSDAVLNRLNDATAKVFGYHDPQASDDPNQREVATSPEFQRALGDAGGVGCGAKAWTYAKGGPFSSKFEQSDLFVTILNESDTFRGSAEYQTLVAEWSVCMKNVGYIFNTPDDASGKFNSRPQITEAELATRSADLSCDKTVKLTENASARSIANFNSVADKYASQINDLAKLERQAYDEVLDRQRKLQSAGVAALRSPERQLTQ